MTFEIDNDEPSAPTLTLSGELDMTNAHDLDLVVEPVIQSSPDRLIIDASALRFADSSAIALLVRWAELVHHVEIREPSPLLRRVIVRMGLATRLQMTP